MKRFRQWVFMLMLVGLVTIPTVQAQNTILTIDFTTIVEVSNEHRTVIQQTLDNNRSILPKFDRFTVTALTTSSEWLSVILVPTYIVDSHWGVEIKDEEIVELLGKYNQNNEWVIALKGTSAFLELATKVPKNFIDFSYLLSNGNPNRPNVMNFLFPWTAGQRWYKTQGWHDGYAMDFQPVIRNNPPVDFAVLASAEGTVQRLCGGIGTNDPYQIFFRIIHPDGSDTVYAHLDANTARYDIIGQNVSQGQFLGLLYNGTVGAGGGLQYNTPCGSGTAFHLHFGLPSTNLMINGYNANNVSSSPFATQYTSSNTRIDNVDSIPPTVNFTGPQTNLWYNTNQRISWTVSDNSSGVRGFKQAWDVEPNSPEYAATAGYLDLEWAGEGKHTVKVRSWDNTGNQGLSEHGWFGYDTSLPNGTLTAPIATNNPTIQLTANASDNLSGVKQVEFYVSYNNLYPPAICTDPSLPYACTWTVPNGVADQDLKFTIHVVDNAGNRATDAGGLITVSLDRTAPTGSVMLNNNWGVADGVAMPLNLLANGTGSAVKSVRVSNDGVNWGAWQPMNSTIWAVLSGSHNGTATAYVQYQDAAGNVSNTITGNIALNFYPNKPQSSNYRIVKNVQAVDGGVMQSGNYQLNGTLGQTIANNGTATSPNYQMTLGYWSKVVQTIIEQVNVFIPLVQK